MKFEKLIVLVVFLIGLFCVFIYAITYTPSPTETLKREIVNAGYTVIVTYENLDKTLSEYVLQSKGEVYFEVIDGCLTNTNGINESVVCYVKKIVNVTYISNKDGNKYQF